MGSVSQEGRFGTMNEYEILLMLDPELSEERGEEIIARVKEQVESRRRHLGCP